MEVFEDVTNNDEKMFKNSFEKSSIIFVEIYWVEKRTHIYLFFLHVFPVNIFISINLT